MGWEIRNKKYQGLSPTERTLFYEKEPVQNVAELWVLFPDGGHPGWYCFIISESNFYYWKEETKQWEPVGGKRTEHSHNRGVISANPNYISFNPAVEIGDYAYWQDQDDEQPVQWFFNGVYWVKSTFKMPSAEVTNLEEYAKHGYPPDIPQKTLFEIDQEVTDNVDGGNAFSLFGGCQGIDGGDAKTKY